MRVSARIARTGVQIYSNADGSPMHEHRPADEVFHPDALATFVGAPVTIGHPPNGVTNATIYLAVGHVVEVHRDGRYLGATLALHDAGAIARVRAGDLVELSCGYAVDLDHSPGVNEDGEEYHAVQRTIRADHVAMGPKNWARCGSACRVA